MQDKKQYSKIGKAYQGVFNSLEIAPVRLASQDIDNWRDAINLARDIRIPRRRKLIELFDNIAIDGKVVTVKEKRVAAITNKNFVFYTKGKAGKPVERIQTEVIDTIFFDEMLELMEWIEAFYGHLVMEIIPGGKGIQGIALIPPSNVVPETGLILPNYMDTLNGIPFRGENADPFCKKYILEFGKTKNLGLLLSIAQYVIYKRGGYGDWAQFAELFGMPFRVGKYNPLDSNSRKLLTDALRIAGGAGFAVIPEGTNLEFVQSNYGSGQSGIFKDLIRECNDEIAQIALGGTMTTTNGASKAQGEVHKEGEHEISAGRLKKIMKFLNGPFRERLVMFGYPEAANGEFKIDNPELIDKKDRITIDTALHNIIEIDPQYFYDQYNVPPPKTGPALKVAQTVDKEEDEEEETKPTKKPVGEKKKTKLSVKLTAYYNDNSCGICKNAHSSYAKLSATPDKEIERLAKLIHAGKLKTGQLDPALLKRTAKTLMQGITTGYLRSPESDSFTEKDEELIRLMRQNINVFSGFKNYEQIKEASEALLDADGNILSFPEYVKKVKEIDNTYNLVHLAPEYDRAVAAGQMGSKWLTFQNLKADFPNLKYITAGDERVRPQHALYNGKIFSMDDPALDYIYPQKEWRCRCDMDATDEPVNSQGLKINTNVAFKGNVGKDGVVFPESHPHFQASEKTKALINKQVKNILD
jgi:SPP1 gp7 family putative phage head morphogenesis protein